MQKKRSIYCTQLSKTKRENEALLAWLLQVEPQLKEANERLPTGDFVRIPHVLDRELWEQLRAKEKEVDNVNQRAEEVEEKFKKL